MSASRSVLFIAAASIVGARAQAPSSTTLAPPPTDLSSIPTPVIERLEPAVQEQLTTARRLVENAIEDDPDGGRGNTLLGRLCMLYLHYELLDAAELCLLEMQSLRPSHFQWSYYQAVLFSRTGEVETAMASLATARTLRPDDVPSLLRLGDLQLLALEPQAAQDAFKSALTLEPQSSAARFGLGRVAAARGQIQDAIAHFEAALAGQPAGSVVHYHLGMAYRDLGDLDRARNELRKNQQRAIAFSDPLMLRLETLGISREEIFVRGVEARREGRPQDAIEAFRQVLGLDPDDAEALFNLARAQIETGELEEAERHLRRALEISPEFFDAHFNLAVLLGRLGREQEAARYLERAVLIDPDHLPTRVLWARLLAQQGDSRRAVEELERALSVDSADRGARLALAGLHEQLGNSSEAAAQFDLLLELSPEDPEVHLGRARNLILAGSYRRAREALDSSLGRLPRDRSLRHLLARFLATCPDPALRDGDRALALARGIVAELLTPDHAETLAMALAETGRFAEAAEWQERVLAQEAAAADADTSSAARRQRLESYRLAKPVRAPWMNEK